VLLLNDCLFLLFISLSTQSGNLWIPPRTTVTQLQILAECLYLGIINNIKMVYDEFKGIYVGRRIELNISLSLLVSETLKSNTKPKQTSL
jgi:hypothetical protein